MSNLSIAFKTISILTAVYGWFIPFLLFPLSNNERVVDIQQEAPISVQIDPELFFSSVPESDSPEAAEPSQEEIEPQKQEEVQPVQPLKPVPPMITTEKKEKPRSAEKKRTASKEASSKIGLQRKKESSKARPRVKKLLQRKRFQKQSSTAEQRGKKSCTATDPNIQQISQSPDTTLYSLPKSLIAHYSSHWKEASRLASLRWLRDKDGTILGITIRNINCKSPLQYSGLQKGDVVLTVNGRSVDSSAKLVKLFPRIQFWKKISLSILRNGNPMVLEYDVRKDA